MNGRPTRIRGLAWIAMTAVVGGFLGTRLAAGDRRIFLPGRTTDGHHQIEIDCLTCHDPFRGVKESACLDCHGARLAESDDSHPKSKFTDPRNADRLESLDARRCIACHREHAPEITRAMGVTLPDDLCFHCHATIGEERESHRGMAFDGCASAGCHNFHDNTALYEDFLVAHAGEPETRTLARVALPDGAEVPEPEARPLGARDAVAPDSPAAAAATIEWAATVHARGGVGCPACHGDPTAGPWTERPGPDACATCHVDELAGWRRGKHGMRTALELGPMEPRLARLPMREAAADRALDCASCHTAHRFDREEAAVDACLACHADDHSLAYGESAHAALRADELAGRVPEGSGVSCATCHLPRFVERRDGAPRVRVQHDQNHDLRPNEKMIRAVCLDCHGLAFAIDALADEDLVRRNFRGRPARHVESLDMAVRREAAHAAVNSPTAKEEKR